MKISSIQTNYSTPSTSFKAFTITPQAREMAVNSAEKMKTVTRAERLFSNSTFVDFSILDNFVPKINIKKTGEALINRINASILGPRAMKFADSNNSIDILLPDGCSAMCQEHMINNQLKDPVDKASYVAEIIEMAGEDRPNRYLI